MGSQQTSRFRKRYTDEELVTSTLASWTPEMVAQSMLDTFFETSTAERFIKNDINGAHLVTLNFVDFQELDIKPVAIRTRVWHKVQALRNSHLASSRIEVSIKDERSPVTHHKVQRNESPPVRRGQSVRGRQPRKVTPMESVSITGNEQVILKPHYCKKGGNCSKWKQQQLLRTFKKENPNFDLNIVGTIMIVGDARNLETPKTYNSKDTLRPLFEAATPTVASSDVLEPSGLPLLQYLREATSRRPKPKLANTHLA